MNVREFIENSGVLEEYVLGVLSEQEAQGVECLAKTYPEIQKEIDVLNQSMGKYMAVYEKQPPAFLKEQIFAQMTFADEDEDLEEEAEEGDVEQVSVQQSRVVPMWSRLSLAASVLLAVLAAWMYTQNNALKSSTENLADRLAVLEAKNQKNEALLSSFESPDVKVLKLNGVEAHPSGSVIVHWNVKNNSVALQVHNLPKPTAGKQYQLWIIGENGPEDMGVIDNDFEGKVLAMKHVSGQPSAFAITLENEGGVPSPTLDQLYVLANV
ncbi:anti-sigma factor [Marinilongibacter aquaticus]|uniref:anti-sigma factor n=1 Tax=Marinilongibacter aquaticus TaxID=2975157 RepID=UPI0021BD84FD|nr:anti-sigma factor [Marinilongibacter aquaticus]UBM57246.1 anti-sigma factor [Marinilongibacter aquaticus]